MSKHFLKAASCLSLSEPPHISLYESRVLVASGDEATLFCAADGIPKPKIRWYRGEVEVNNCFFKPFHSDLRPSINGLVTDGNTKLCCCGFILALFQSTTANKIDSTYPRL